MFGSTARSIGDSPRTARLHFRPDWANTLPFRAPPVHPERHRLKPEDEWAKSDDSPTMTTIVREEQTMLGKVLQHLSLHRPSRPPPTEDYEQQLISLRDQ